MLFIHGFAMLLVHVFVIVGVAMLVGKILDGCSSDNNKTDNTLEFLEKEIQQPVQKESFAKSLGRKIGRVKIKKR